LPQRTPNGLQQTTADSLYHPNITDVIIVRKLSTLKLVSFVQNMSSESRVGSYDDWTENIFIIPSY